MKSYEKLVRDRIPEIIERAGKTATWREFRDDEFRVALKAKALEEAQELFDADDGALLSSSPTSRKSWRPFYQRTAIRAKNPRWFAIRKTKPGAFTRRLFLESVSD